MLAVVIQDIITIFVNFVDQIVVAVVSVKETVETSAQAYCCSMGHVGHLVLNLTRNLSFLL